MSAPLAADVQTSPAQVHGAKVQNNYGLCKIFAKIQKRIFLRLME
jgi:hypothetical protein